MNDLKSLKSDDWNTILFDYKKSNFPGTTYYKLISDAIQNINENIEIANETFFENFYNRNILHILLICNNNGVYDEIIKKLAKYKSLLTTKDQRGKTPYELLHNLYKTGIVNLSNFTHTVLILLNINVIEGWEKNEDIQPLMDIIVQKIKGDSNKEELKILAQKNQGTVSPTKIEGIDIFRFIYFKFIYTKYKLRTDDFNYFKETSIILMKLGHDVKLKKEIRDLTIYITSLLHIFCQNIKNITEEDIKIVVKTRAELLNLKDEFGRTPIHILFEHNYYSGYESKINLLLTEENINFVDNSGFSLLHVACQSGNLEAVKFLLNKNIYTNSTCSYNQRTILHYAAISGNIELFNYLLEHINNSKNILYCADYEGNTPLHLLFKKNKDVSVENIRSLQIKNFLTIKNKLQETLLHMTCKSGNLEMLKHLHESGANLEELTLSKKTALHLAAERGHRGIVQWVIQTKKVKIDLTDVKQKTAIDYAKNNLPTQNNDQNKYRLIVEDLTIGLLYDKIEKMFDYGDSLKEHSKEKSAVACELAESLKTIFSRYLQNDRSKSATDKFKNDFIETLHSKDKEMQAYRFNWDTIKYNILIALTGIGLLFIAANLIYTRINQGRALFFYQKRTTTGEEILNDIEIAASSENLGFLTIS